MWYELIEITFHVSFKKVKPVKGATAHYDNMVEWSFAPHHICWSKWRFGSIFCFDVAVFNIADTITYEASDQTILLPFNCRPE